MATLIDNRPLIVHVVYKFDTGGLENGVVNLINSMPVNRYRHAIVALTNITEFRHRISRSDVGFFSLDKKPGHSLVLYPKLFQLFKELRPAIVHTRNLAALEVVLPAWAAGVRIRIHGEHGRDVDDLDGSNRKYQWIRRIYRPFVTHYLALSRDLAGYLQSAIKVSNRKITQVYNGVDADRFSPKNSTERFLPPGCPFVDDGLWLVGTVGRMQWVKDQLTLAKAFVRALEIQPLLRNKIRLILVGEGVLRQPCQEILDIAGCADLAWLPGERIDIPEIMRGLDCFVLPSLAEGISNTILEAMASGLPVIATDVGGNADLVEHRITGLIVPSADIEAMAQALVQLASDPSNAKLMGLAGRKTVVDKFSLDAMVGTYQGLYDRLLRRPVETQSPPP